MYRVLVVGPGAALVPLPGSAHTRGVSQPRG
jgi:hypothetical protein